MPSMSRNVFRDFLLILSLGTTNFVGFSLGALMLLLAWLGIDRIIWALLWIPIYLIEFHIGYRRFKEIQAAQHARSVWLKYKGKSDKLDERERLDLAREALSQHIVRQKIQQELKNLGKVKVKAKEQWRLGLITPGYDTISTTDVLNLTRRAVLYPESLWGQRLTAIGISAGTSGFNCSIQIPNDQDLCPLKDIMVNSRRLYHPIPLDQFLEEEGFPIKPYRGINSYDPRLITVISCVIGRSPSSGKYGLFPATFFVQRVVIDNVGNVLWLGLDDGEDTPRFIWVMTRPANLQKLFLEAYSNEEIEPLLWCCTSPVSFDQMPLPIVDTPLAGEAISTLVVDPFDPYLRSKLFIPRAEADFEEMLDQLHALWEDSIVRCDRHLLQLTQDATKLQQYFSHKEEILEKYYLIEEIELRENLPPIFLQASKTQGLAMTLEQSRATWCDVEWLKIKERFERLWKLHPKRRFVNMGYLLGALLALSVAIIYGGTIFNTLWFITAGALFGATLVRDGQIASAGFWDGIAASHQWAFNLAAIGGGLAYLFSHDWGLACIWAMNGFLLGSFLGTGHWWDREARILQRELFSKWPADEFPKYRNERYRFTMRYPPGWEAISSFNVNADMAFVSPDKEAAIYLTVGAYKAPETLEEYLDEVKKAIGAVLTPQDYIEDLKGHKPPPERLGQQDVPYTAEAVYVRRIPVLLLRQRRKFKKFSFPRQGLQFVFSYLAPIEKFDLYKDVFDQCVRAIEFEK